MKENEDESELKKSHASGISDKSENFFCVNFVWFLLFSVHFVVLVSIKPWGWWCFNGFFSLSLFVKFVLWFYLWKLTDTNYKLQTIEENAQTKKLMTEQYQRQTQYTHSSIVAGYILVVPVPVTVTGYTYLSSITDFFSLPQLD